MKGKLNTTHPSYPEYERKFKIIVDNMVAKSRACGPSYMKDGEESHRITVEYHEAIKALQTEYAFLFEQTE